MKKGKCKLINYKVGDLIANMAIACTLDNTQQTSTAFKIGRKYEVVMINHVTGEVWLTATEKNQDETG